MKTIVLDNKSEKEFLSSLLIRKNELESIINNNGSISTQNDLLLAMKVRTIEKLIEQVKQ